MTAYFRVERTQYAEIAVDVPRLLAEWADDRAESDETDDEFVKEVLWKIGVRDLMHSGDFIEVLETDDEEAITSVPPLV